MRLEAIFAREGPRTKVALERLLARVHSRVGEEAADQGTERRDRGW